MHSDSSFKYAVRNNHAFASTPASRDRLEHVNRPNSYHSSQPSSADNRILDNSFFIGKREQKLKNHHLSIIEIFQKWSEIGLNDFYNKYPFRTNIEVDVFDRLKSFDLDGEAVSHIHSSNREEYVKTASAIASMETLQKKYTRLLEQLLDTLRISISPSINLKVRNEIIDYYIALFVKNKDYEESERERQLRFAKERPAVLTFPTSNDENPQFTEVYSPEEGKEEIIQLVDNRTTDGVNKFREMDDILRGINTHLGILKSNLGIIMRHESSIGLKGKCKIEDELSIPRSIFRYIRKFLGLFRVRRKLRILN